MNNEPIRERIRGFISEEFLPKGYNLKDNESLFDTGVIDSLGMLKLMTFIERNFAVAVNPTEVSIDSFDTIEKIEKFISEKTKKDA